jgi:hypothetical protein
MADAGKNLCAAHRGATQKHVEILTALIQEKGSEQLSGNALPKPPSG